MENGMKQRKQHAKSDTDEDHSNVLTPLIKVGKEALMIWDELPEWRRDNMYITSGFRPETNSYWECIKSMGYIHNETGNIYTHLFAAFYLAGLGIWWTSYSHEHYPVTSDDDLVFLLFFIGSTTCAILSVIYHVLMNHSESTYCFCLKLDFVGILTVTAGCFPPALWYIFPCLPREEKLAYIQIDLVAQFCAAMLALFSKTFQAHAMRPLRALVFSTTASTLYYPIIIKVYQVGWTRAYEEYGAGLYALTLAIYATSAVIYALRLTEAWKPGTFDIWGHSHQIFHVGMVIGLTVHFMAFVQAMHQFYVVKRGRCPD